MKVTVLPGKISGEIAAIPSKSALHRQLIYAALADKSTFISCRETEAEDIKATIDCLSALGAVIGRNENGFVVTPLDRTDLPNMRRYTTPFFFPCGESGSTLRFMLPVVCALGLRGAFEMKGRLPQRPLAPLDSQLVGHGVNLWRDPENILHCEGRLQPADDYNLPGDISSQYVTGLLMALPLLERPSRLTVFAPIESADYVVLTLKIAAEFGQKPVVNNNLYDETQNDRFDTRQNTVYNITGTGYFNSPVHTQTEGDWSNAAFWLCAGAMPRGNIRLSGLQKDSTQGDREIYNILIKMGAEIIREGNIIHVKEGGRYASEIDGRAIPDLLPVLAALASVGNGITIFRNASRLRLKESDRIKATAQTLSGLGATVRETSDGLVIEGVKRLRGGTVDAQGDHRIAMTAAIASAACEKPVTITGAQAVNKSYPKFWEDLASLGKRVIYE